MECDICKHCVHPKDFYTHAKNCCTAINIKWDLPSEGNPITRVDSVEALQTKNLILQNEKNSLLDKIENLQNIIATVEMDSLNLKNKLSDLEETHATKTVAWKNNIKRLCDKLRH